MLGNVDVYYKGYDIAIKALAYIKNDIPDFMLYIAGNGDGKNIKRLLKKYGLNNYVKILGPLKSGEEVFSFDNLIKDFSVERVNAAAAVFDIKKMRWINQHHIRMLSKKDLWNKLQPFFKRANLDLNTDPKWQDKSLELFTHNLEVLSDAIELYKPLADNIFDIK